MRFCLTWIPLQCNKSTPEIVTQMGTRRSETFLLNISFLGNKEAYILVIWKKQTPYRVYSQYKMSRDAFLGLLTQFAIFVCFE